MDLLNSREKNFQLLIELDRLANQIQQYDWSNFVYSEENESRLRAKSRSYIEPDPLSDYLSVSKSNVSKYCLQPEINAYTFLSHQEASDLSISDIIKIQNLLLGKKENFRKVSAGTNRDERGESVEFVEPREIEFQVNALCEIVNSKTIYCPIFISVVVLVELTRIHPFTDGNGRLSRFLSYHILFSSKHDHPRYHFPVNWMRVIDTRTYLLALRRAEHQNDWEPLIKYMSSIFKLFLAIIEAEH